MIMWKSKNSSSRAIAILSFSIMILSIACKTKEKNEPITIKPALNKEFNGYNAVFIPDSYKLLKNKPITPFKLITPNGRVFKSEELKGKVILMDFWATWCAPCRQLTHELDSILNKYQGRDDFQMIGVNVNEDLVNKGYDPAKYWKEKGYKFPMTVNDNAYGKIVDAGNPTVFIVDQEGNLRARWDAWSPGTAEEISFFVWVLLENPEISFTDLQNAIVNKENIKALHFCDQFIKEYPAKIKEFAPIKFNLMKNLSDEEALIFIRQVIDTIGDYRALGKTLLDSSSIDVSRFSREDLFECLLKEMKQDKNDMIYSTLAYRYFNSGKKDEAIRSMEKAIRIAREGKTPQMMVNNMSKALDEFKKSTGK